MKMNVNEIEVNGEKYVKKDSVSNSNIQPINFTGEESVASLAIGKKVIVRTRNEGLNAGIVEMADETGVVLKDCRRLHYHEPLDKKTSWYEGIAMTGISSKSRVSCTVDRKIIIEDYSFTVCTDNAFKTIMEKKPNETK